MKKYEKIIKQLCRIDGLSSEAWGKSLALNPISEEYRELQRIQDDYEDEARALLAQLQRCIRWYRQRARMAADFELILELETEHDKLYEHMICDLSDEEITQQAVEYISNVLGAEFSDIDTEPEPEDREVDDVQENGVIRRETVEAMSALLRMVSPHLLNCRYAKKREDDYIVITCANGCEYLVYVTGESEVSIVAAVFNDMRVK